MMMRRLAFACLFIAFCINLYGQEEALRVEIETKFRSEEYQVVPLNEHGLLLFVERKDKVLGGKNTWYFTHYNTDLEKVWETQIQVNNWMDYQGFDTDGSQLYLIFTRFASEDFEFIKVDTKAQQAEKLKVPALSRLTFRELKVMHGHAFVAGLAKNTPILLNFNLNKGVAQEDLLKILPTSTTKKSDFEFLDKDTTNQLINFNFVNWKGGMSNLVIRSYDPSGEPLSEIAIPRTDDKNLLSGKQSITEEGNAVIIGTYANGSSRLSDGLYITEFDGEKQRYIRYYSFTDLQNFFNYLPEKQKLKMEKRKEKKESKNKDLNFQYRLLIHNLISKNDKYTLIAEAYYPTYRYDNGTVWNGRVGFYNRYRYNYPMGSQRIFDGFQYTHAMLASFSKDGKLEWDNSFELEQVKYFNLREVVKLHFDQDKVKLLYHYRGKLLSKVIEGNQVNSGKNEIPLTTDHENDRVRRSYRSDLAFWYDNYFIAWGFQRIKNKEDEVKNTRNVFFFNKVPF
ncbi:MAG: hypothetical protein ACPGJS_02280 [Flammeovirgaceae bacterium]